MSAEVPLAGPALPAGAAAGVVMDQRFDAGTLHLLRAAVLAVAVAAGMPGVRAGDVMLAAHELAANAVQHGAGTGQLLMWSGRGALRMQVRDGRAAGGTGPDGWPYQPGHGLHLVRQVTDQMSVLSGPDWSVVTAVFTLPPAGDGQEPGES